MICTVSGTSASCPVVAGMISLVNSARLAQGNSTVGFLNPALYANYPAFTNDITSGDNKCMAVGYMGVRCCREGFYAATGWDPVTGLGSIDFKRFQQVMLGLVYSTRSNAETDSVSAADANKHSSSSISSTSSTIKRDVIEDELIISTNTTSVLRDESIKGQLRGQPGTHDSLLATT